VVFVALFLYQDPWRAQPQALLVLAFLLTAHRLGPGIFERTARLQRLVKVLRAIEAKPKKKKCENIF
jgi:hypothetical protein